jgi:hypothetical protein
MPGPTLEVHAAVNTVGDSEGSAPCAPALRGAANAALRTIAATTVVVARKPFIFDLRRVDW